MKVLDKHEKVEIILTYSEAEVLMAALAAYGDLKNYLPKKELVGHTKHFNFANKLSDKLEEYINT